MPGKAALQPTIHSEESEPAARARCATVFVLRSGHQGQPAMRRGRHTLDDICHPGRHTERIDDYCDLEHGTKSEIQDEKHRIRGNSGGFTQRREGAKKKRRGTTTARNTKGRSGRMPRMGADVSVRATLSHDPLNDHSLTSRRTTAFSHSPVPRVPVVALSRIWWEAPFRFCCVRPAQVPGLNDKSGTCLSPNPLSSLRSAPLRETLPVFPNGGQGGLATRFLI